MAQAVEVGASNFFFTNSHLPFSWQNFFALKMYFWGFVKQSLTVFKEIINQMQNTGLTEAHQSYSQLGKLFRVERSRSWDEAIRMLL